MKSKIVLALAIGVASLLYASAAKSQGMAVNTSGASANSSAIMDVSSTTQGMLIPRMLSGQRTSISSPATGLLVYQTDAPAGFYFYDGASWTSLNSGLSNVTTQGNTFNGANELVQTNGSSVVPAANLGTGSSITTKFLRGDNTWQTVSGGSGTVTSVSSGVLTSGTTAFTDTIFHTTVINPTTTPSIFYTFNMAAANTVLTNSVNAPSIPVYGKVVPNALYATSGTPSSSTYYRGDGSWQTISSGNSYIFATQISGISNAFTTSYGAVCGNVSGNINNPYPANGIYQGLTIFPTSFTLDAMTVTGVTRAVTSATSINVTIELYDNGSPTGVTATVTIPSSVGVGTSASWSGTYSVNAGDSYYYVITLSATGDAAPYLIVGLHGH